MSPAPSPAIEAGSLVTVTIKVEGQEINSAFQVLSVDCWNGVNRVPQARLVLADGSPAEGNFPISNLETFLPGQKVEVAAGYNGLEVRIFAGVIVKQGIEIAADRASTLILDLADEAIRMTLERKNAVFEKIKDSDLIGKLIQANKLKKKVTATTAVHETVVQYYASDWDLMLTRAEVNGFVVISEEGTVTVAPPETKASAVLSVDYGTSILDLDAEMNAATQFASSAIKSYTWDAGSQKLIDSGPGRVDVEEPGNVSSAQLAKVFNVKTFTQQTGAGIEKGSLQAWSSAELLKTKLSKIRGSVRFQGSSKARTGTTLELLGLGNRFSGTVYVSAVHQSIRGGKWLTTAGFGLSSDWFAAEALNISAPEASGLLPPIQGLQTGIVKKVAKDPGGEFRVQLNLPLLQNSNDVWARLGTFYASNKIGALFYPEIGDEVIVGFMNEDPRFPVILGSVYSKKRPPPFAPNDKNDTKAIVTREKLTISFDDKKKILEIRTPGNHVIKLDDSTQALSVKDDNKNTISLSKGGIELNSGSNLKIVAKGNITIQAGQNLKNSAKLTASTEGLQVTLKAKTKFSAKGTASAELIASGILTVRGALVKIN